VKIHNKVFNRIVYPVGDELTTVFNFDVLLSLCECLYSVYCVYLGVLLGAFTKTAKSGSYLLHVRPSVRIY